MGERVSQASIFGGMKLGGAPRIGWAYQYEPISRGWNKRGRDELGLEATIQEPFPESVVPLPIAQERHAIYPNDGAPPLASFFREFRYDYCCAFRQAYRPPPIIVAACRGV
jgi:hypothetical protein